MHLGFFRFRYETPLSEDAAGAAFINANVKIITNAYKWWRRRYRVPTRCSSERHRSAVQWFTMVGSQLVEFSRLEGESAVLHTGR